MAKTLARQTKSPGHTARQTSGLPSTHAVAELLRAELLGVRGCTEPAAIAYAALLARRSIRAKFNFGCARVWRSELVWSPRGWRLVRLLYCKGLFPRRWVLWWLL
jgi:hypothetical protein